MVKMTSISSGCSPQINALVKFNGKNVQILRMGPQPTDAPFFLCSIRAFCLNSSINVRFKSSQRLHYPVYEHAIMMFTDRSKRRFRCSKGGNSFGTFLFPFIPVCGVASKQLLLKLPNDPNFTEIVDNIFDRIRCHVITYVQSRICRSACFLLLQQIFKQIELI